METRNVVAAFLLASILWYFSALPKNIIQARKTGLPMVITLVAPENLPWMIFSGGFQKELQKYLPESVYEHVRVTIYGWEFRDRWKIFEKKGLSYILVTPKKNEIWSADPAVASRVLLRRKDFLQLAITKKIMSRFGPALTASDGEEWQRHRRLVAPAVNERIMNAIWNEATQQTEDMLSVLLKTRNETNLLESGFRTITVNVVSKIAYGTRASWQDSIGAKEAPIGYSMSFVDAVILTADYFLAASLIPICVLRSPVMPPTIRRLGAAVADLPRHIRKSIDARQSSTEASADLVSAFTKFMQEEREKNSQSTKSLYLREDEVIGNLFNFTVAGFDTTASSITYGFFMLATEPAIQDWLFEDIERINRTAGDKVYEDVYPEMTRCLALMYEACRLYTPVPRISRRTETPQNLGFHVPADVNVYLCVAGIHVSPDLYADPLEFRPSRWIQTDPVTGRETLITPPKGAYLTWSEGPRSCPGIKMSQVEFTAIVFKIVSKYKIEIAELDGESQEDARQRLRDIVIDSQPIIALQPRNSKDAWLRLTAR